MNDIKVRLRYRGQPHSVLIFILFRCLNAVENPMEVACGNYSLVSFMEKIQLFSDTLVVPILILIDTFKIKKTR